MTNFILSFLPWIWLTLLIIFVVIEAFTMSLTTIWPAIASLPLIFIAKTGLPFKWQLLIFVLLTLVLVIFTRPFAVKKLKIGNNKTNVNKKNYAAAALIFNTLLVVLIVAVFFVKNYLIKI